MSAASTLTLSTTDLYHCIKHTQQQAITSSPQFSPKFYFTVLITNDLIALLGKVPNELLLTGLSNIQYIADTISPKSFYPSPQSLFTKRTAPFIPNYPHKMHTLVLDLDETLGHRFQEKYLVRPFVSEFINSLSEYFEIILFTAASQRYADSVMNLVDPQKKINLRLYKQHTIEIDGVLVKDLACLGRDLSKVIIIDNSADSFQRQPANGIEIESWVGDPNDRDLKDLLPFLIKIATENTEDVRIALSTLKMNN
ncbi:unnamed protein product [Blepharisma stoltei]|uniref:Mitochondrial import inner membrane translocase subunit TIM50 n=1 Tax=Blepharisma stoltei TaxID=1481888 RepID=A0AAU9JTM4_9CILI|nr:unnamed protein product [Blepharisma stoltei]